ncbi:transcriptional regulatory protein RtcR [Escherichia coli]|uniref:Transcriptional regulatory protein RtcR n=1 Tax=Escherichia coli TaxID=562 RepID=A0A376MK24_ECOLX|nr:transcriptional regulatory protein RtcR [Escherichia coli]
MLFLDEIGELGADEQAMLLKAIEEKTFYPFGSDRQVSSDFHLSPERCAICVSWLPKANSAKICTRGSISGPSPCRVYSSARKILNRTWIMKWSATPHSLVTAVRFNTEARRAWLAFATSPQATWRGNFRELSASVTRMATFATSGRITLDVVEDEINRLRYNCREPSLRAYTTAGRRGRKHRSLRPYATGTRYRYLPPGKVAFCCRTPAF